LENDTMMAKSGLTQPAVASVPGLGRTPSAAPPSQNSQTRSDQALQHKLNAIADGMADLMAHLFERDDDDQLRNDLLELRLAIGLEQHDSSSRRRADGQA
jgi:hypothetical protein